MHNIVQASTAATAATSTGTAAVWPTLGIFRSDGFWKLIPLLLLARACLAQADLIMVRWRGPSLLLFLLLKCWQVMVARQAATFEPKSVSAAKLMPLAAAAAAAAGGGVSSVIAGGGSCTNVLTC